MSIEVPEFNKLAYIDWAHATKAQTKGKNRFIKFLNLNLKKVHE